MFKVFFISSNPVIYYNLKKKGNKPIVYYYYDIVFNGCLPIQDDMCVLSQNKGLIITLDTNTKDINCSFYSFDHVDKDPTKLIKLKYGFYLYLQGFKQFSILYGGY